MFGMHLGFIDGKVKYTKQFKHYPGFWAKLIKFKTNLLKRKQDLHGSKEKPIIKTKQYTDFKKNKTEKKSKANTCDIN